MSAPRPQHAPLTQFEIVDDCLQIGGMPLTRLAERVGQTPFYAYDRSKLSERVAMLRRCLPPEIELHYAMKANPMPAVVQHLARLVDGIVRARSASPVPARATATSAARSRPASC
jgi:diaminopimelate decarboxylase